MRPTTRLIRWLNLWFITALLAAFWPFALTLWWATGLFFLLLVSLDTRQLYKRQLPEIERHTPASHSVNVWRTVRLTIRNGSAFPVRAFLIDHAPANTEVKQLPLHLELPAHSQLEETYLLRFTSRGEHQFTGFEVLVDSPLGLTQRRHFISSVFGVRVYPDFAALAKYALLATNNRLSQIGIRHRQRRGQGLEFHQLRDYRESDSLRQVDWKATSRLRKLIAREYQDERDQQILFMLDSSHRMRAKDGSISHFDQALNAMMLLSHVALKQNDAVGCLSFSRDTRWVPPQKSRKGLSALMENLFDLEPDLYAPDYRMAATRIAESTHKRSLIIILTNLRDEDSGELMAAVQVLQKRHLVLVASLKETAVARLAEQPVDDFESALTLAAAAHYFNSRHKVLETLKYNGVKVLDVEPAALPVTLVNRYLDIKRRGAL